MAVRFTDRELDLMQVLWEHGSATVPEMQDALEEEFAYSTVSTILRILEDKGYVGHSIEGRFHRYHPLVERGEARRSALAHLTETLFRGSPEVLLSHFVSDASLSREEIDRLKKILDDHDDRGEGPL